MTTLYVLIFGGFGESVEMLLLATGMIAFAIGARWAMTKIDAEDEKKPEAVKHFADAKSATAREDFDEKHVTATAE